MSSSNGMEEYYQKVIQLQERLRHSEEERLKLEMKFNEMLQVMKEEEEAHFKKLRTKYKQFLEEDRRRQQRNDKILEALDRIENRAQIWEAKTEKFKAFRRKYQDYLKHASGQRNRSPLETDKSPITKYDLHDREPSFADRNSKVDPEARNDIMEKYLQSLSSPKCKEDILQRRNEKPPESKYSNLGNINSVYWKNPRTSEKADLEKEDDYTQLKNTKDLENALKQNSNAPSSLSKDYDYSGLGEGGRKYMEKDNDDYLSFGRKPSNDFSLLDKKPLAETQNKEYGFSSNVSQNKYIDDKLVRRISQQAIDNDEQKEESVKEPEKSQHARQVHNDLERLLEQHKGEVQNQSIRTVKNDTTQKPTSADFQFKQKEQFQSIPKQPIRELPKEINSLMLEQQTQPLPREQIQSISTQPTPPAPREISSSFVDNATRDIKRASNQLPRQLEGTKNALQNDQDKNQEMSNTQMLNDQPLQRPIMSDVQMNIQTQRRSSEASTSEINVAQPQTQKQIPVVPERVEPRNDAEEKIQNLDNQQQQISSEGKQPDLPLQQLLEKQPNIGGQQYDPSGHSQYDATEQPQQEYAANEQQYYDENGQPLQQYDGDDRTSQQFDQNEQLLSQYDQSEQLVQQYDGNGQLLQQYDENGQPLQQLNENGQQLQQYYNENDPLQSLYYDENGQLLEKYDENGQLVQQYDENGQPLQQYYNDNEQALQQYDENGQPISQYDENGQPLPQYNANGQPMVQYDENGQPIPQYDASGQPILQYDENGQLLSQYDPNGQIQYDQNGQPVVQYDENGQPIIQYDQNGQPLLQYDENGQLLPQYNETSQPIQYYDENGQPVQYYEGEAAQQYDENGQPIQQQYGEQPQGDQQQYYEQQQDLGQVQQGQEQPQPQAEAKSNVLDMLETDTESAKQDTKISNDSDFDFSNG